MHRNLIITGALSLLLLSLLYIAVNEDEGALPEGPDVPAEEAYDYFIAGLDSTRFALDGTARYRIRAERFTHYPDAATAVAAVPDVTLFNEENPPWHITADRANIPDDPESRPQSVELRENVVIRHTDANGRQVNIYTDFLTLYPDSRHMRTDHQVRMETQGSRMIGEGLIADLNSNRIKLLANVRGQYAPGTLSSFVD